MFGQFSIGVTNRDRAFAFVFREVPSVLIARKLCCEAHYRRRHEPQTQAAVTQFGARRNRTYLSSHSISQAVFMFLKDRHSRVGDGLVGRSQHALYGSRWKVRLSVRVHAHRKYFVLAIVLVGARQSGVEHQKRGLDGQVHCNAPAPQIIVIPFVSRWSVVAKLGMLGPARRRGNKVVRVVEVRGERCAVRPRVRTWRGVYLAVRGRPRRGLDLLRAPFSPSLSNSRRLSLLQIVFNI